MQNSTEDFTNLMERVRSGSDEAARELLELYGSHIYRAVRRRLNQQLRPRFDSQDFVQAVWASFFANRAVIVKFDEPGTLIAFLSRVASNKVAEQCRRRLMTEKHDINRERSTSLPYVDRMMSADDPTASQVAIANEQWNRLIEGQPPHYQQMLALRRQGATYPEIAEQIGVHERTVRRIIQKLTERII